MVITVAPVEGRPVPVGDFFKDGEDVVDLYSGQKLKVEDHSLKFIPRGAKVAVFARP